MKRQFLLPILTVAVVLIGAAIHRTLATEEEPPFGTTVTDTELLSNGTLSIQLEFMDRLHLANGQSKAWSDTLKQPYIHAANKWLSALAGVEGKAKHTLTIQITVNTLENANGIAGPSEEEQVGQFMLPVEGQLIVGNHTYESGFDPTEFNANILHEMGHIMGLGTVTEDFTVNDKNAGGPVFRGVDSNQGAKYYNQIYGTAVDFFPMSDDKGHLYDYVWQDDRQRTLADGRHLPPLTQEVMANGTVLGKVTLGVLDDIGYIVDYSAAETYTRPFNSNGSGINF